MRRGWSGAGLVVAVLLWSGVARAQQCVASTTGLSFGVYNPLSATPTTITGMVTVNCQATVSLFVSYTIQIGAGSGGSFMTRSLSAGSYKLGYQIYTNSGLTSIWGDGSSGTNTIGDGYTLSVIAPVIRTYTVYGRIPALQNVGVGSYLDMLQVLVTY